MAFEGLPAPYSFPEWRPCVLVGVRRVVVPIGPNSPIVPPPGVLHLTPKVRAGLGYLELAPSHQQAREVNARLNWYFCRWHETNGEKALPPRFELQPLPEAPGIRGINVNGQNETSYLLRVVDVAPSLERGNELLLQFRPGFWLHGAIIRPKIFIQANQSAPVSGEPA